MKTIHCVLAMIVSIVILNCNDPYTQLLVRESRNTLPILIEDVAIFNGKENILFPNKDVFIEKGIITAITENSTVKDIRTYRKINGKGKTLMPGLVDAHVHLTGSGSVPWKNTPANEAYNLSAYLHSGITTVYDLGGIASDLEKLSSKVDNGEVLGPTVYHSHIPITVKNGHPIPLTKEMLGWPLKSFVNVLAPTIGHVDEAKKTIDKYLEEDVDYVKIIYDQIPPGSPTMTLEILEALIKEAHQRNFKVFVHVGSPQNAVDAVEAGADILAHGIWRGKLKSEQADIIANSNIPIIYTLAAFQNVAKINLGQYYPTAQDTLLVPKKILDPVTGAKGLDVKGQEVINAFFNDVAEKSPFLLDNFKMLRERNARIIVGTDSSLPGTYAGSTYLQELDALRKYGMSNFEILTGATYLPSKLFLNNPDFGTVEAGKKANLLLINGNPLENIALVKTPETIIMDGRIIVKVAD